jgi:hypothetical protein
MLAPNISKVYRAAFPGHQELVWKLYFFKKFKFFKEKMN